MIHFNIKTIWKLSEYHLVNYVHYHHKLSVLSCSF